MYSYTDYCDLKIRNGKKEEFLKWLEENKDYKDTTTIDEDNNVEIEIEDGWKIISYWYESFLDELEQLNNFLIGSWVLIFETHEEKAIIEFGEEVKISLGTMEFKDYKIDDFRKEVKINGKNNAFNKR